MNAGATSGRRLRIYQLDAFADRLFEGNPAAVCPLDDWLPDALLQSIASENNLSETAFFRPVGEDFELRWFTPALEVDLCGHATLAAAAVVFATLRDRAARLRFHSRSGILTVDREDDLLVLDFPARPGQPSEVPPALAEALGAIPVEAFRSRDWMAVFETEAEVRAIRPDLDRLSSLESLGVIVTAPGEKQDFVFRFFAPRAGIPEDPATGSAHCTLAPYWCRRLDRASLHARQVSARGGDMWVTCVGERVRIGGHVRLYMEGEILLP